MAQVTLPVRTGPMGNTRKTMDFSKRLIMLLSALLVVTVFLTKQRNSSSATAIPPALQHAMHQTMAVCKTKEERNRYNCTSTWNWTSLNQWSPSSDLGTEIFSIPSKLSGQIQVTTHKVDSTQFTSPSSSDGITEDWRVLRIPGQSAMMSVNRVITDTKTGLAVAASQCQGFEYAEAMSAALATQIGLKHGLGTPNKKLKLLITGLGGGTLPLLYSKHFPKMSIDVVEIDPEIIKTAHEAMAYPPNLPNVKVHLGDAKEYLEKYVASGQPHYDFIILDAYDADIHIPETHLGETYARLVSQALDPAKGTLLMNFIPDDHVPTTEQTFKKAMLAGSAAANGFSYHIQCPIFPNIISVCTRGVGNFASETDEVVKQKFKAAAESVENDIGFCFPVGDWSISRYVKY